MTEFDELDKQILEFKDFNKDLVDENLKFLEEIERLNKTNRNLNKYIDHLECKLGGE